MRMAAQHAGRVAAESARAPLPGKARSAHARDAWDREADHSVKVAVADRAVSAAGGSSRAEGSHHYFKPRPAGRLPSFIQAKLKVGAINDPLEQEADRVADQVMRMPAPEIAPASAPLQISRKCTACESEEEKLHRKEAGTAQTVPAEAPASVHEVLSSPGQPLDASTRAYFEPRFGRDLSGVRIHSGTLATASAQEVNAKAYTVGQDIVSGAGGFAPGTCEGKRLLAHELTHVAQQCDVGQNPSDRSRERLALPNVVRRQAIDLPPSSEEVATKFSSTEHDTICLKPFQVRTWGQDTCCSHYGFWDNDAVDKRTGKKGVACNKWPLFLALHANAYGFGGVASCPVGFLGNIAEIRNGKNLLRVYCVDVREDEKNIIEINPRVCTKYL